MKEINNTWRNWDNFSKLVEATERRERSKVGAWVGWSLVALAWLTSYAAAGWGHYIYLPLLVAALVTYMERIEVPGANLGYAAAGWDHFTWPAPPTFRSRAKTWLQYFFLIGAVVTVICLAIEFVPFLNEAAHVLANDGLCGAGRQTWDC